jgi:hypothetical protein
MHHLSKEIKELLNKKSSTDFLQAARLFVALLENFEISKEIFYKKAHKTLSQLYFTGLALESFEKKFLKPTIELNKMVSDIDVEQNTNLISMLGNDCYYWEVFNPSFKENEGKPIRASLIDDFGDIYSDLKKELIKIDQIGTDEAIENAFWQLKFGFNQHWGNHCIDAIRALHYLLYDGK